MQCKRRGYAIVKGGGARVADNFARFYLNTQLVGGSRGTLRQNGVIEAKWRDPGRSNFTSILPFCLNRQQWVGQLLRRYVETVQEEQ